MIKLDNAEGRRAEQKKLHKHRHEGLRTAAKEMEEEGNRILEDLNKKDDQAGGSKVGGKKYSAAVSPPPPLSTPFPLRIYIHSPISNWALLASKTVSGRPLQSPCPVLFFAQKCIRAFLFLKKLFLFLFAGKEGCCPRRFPSRFRRNSSGEETKWTEQTRCKNCRASLSGFSK